MREEEWTGGWALVVLEGRPVYLLLLGVPHTVVGDESLSAWSPHPRGAVRPRDAGDGEITLSVDGRRLGSGVVPPGTVTNGQADGNASRIGHDAGFPVSDDYAPFVWTGTVHHVVVEATPPTFRDFGPRSQTHFIGIDAVPRASPMRNTG